MKVNGEQVGKAGGDISHLGATFQIVDRKGNVLYKKLIERTIGITLADLKEQYAKLMSEITRELNKDLAKRFVPSKS